MLQERRTLIVCTNNESGEECLNRTHTVLPGKPNEVECIICHILGNVPPGVHPEAHQWFSSVDTDRSGYISQKELKQALLNSNSTPFNDETCMMMFSE